MSATDAANAAANAAAVEEVDDVPALLDANDAAADPQMAARVAAATAAAAGKTTKKYQKAMAKMGLKPEAGIVKVIIKKGKGVNFSISKPEVYRFPNTNTFVFFGETSVDEVGNEAQQAAARTFAAQPAAAAPVAAAPAAAAGAVDEADEDAGDVPEKEIEIVMSQANVSRPRAIRALKNNKNDIVNAIMELTM